MDSKYNAKGDEIWFVTDNKYDADKKIFYESSKYNADLKVYFTKSKYDVKWVKSHKLKGRIG